MKTKIKFCIGFGIGLAAALLIWTPVVSFWLGSMCLSVWLGMAVAKRRNKIVSCFLASAMAVSPELVAEDFAAGYNGQTCYCFTPEAEPPEQHAVTISFIIEDDAPRILSLRHPPMSELVSFDELNESLAAWGINLNGPLQYAQNAQPASAGQMPFLFGDHSAPLTIYPDRPQYPVIVEVASELSPEFTMWQPVARFSTPAGVRIDFRDSPEGPQSFYRVRIVRAPEDFQAQGPILLGCGLGLLAGTAVVGVLAVRACARNRKKFEKMLPPPKTNDVNRP